MVLNDAGRMIEIEWLALTKRFANIELHEFIVMPNHFQGILEIVEPIWATVGATLVVSQNDTVAQKLEASATVRNFRTVQTEGNKEVERAIDYYNLDVIISVGYRRKTKAR